MVISILNPKGGCGKSTLTTNLAHALQREGRSVLIVDTDPQGTMRDWQAMQDEHCTMPPVIGVDPKKLTTDLERLSMAYDLVIIDGTAKMMQGLGLAVKASTLILIPIQPSAADMWAVAGLVELIRTRQQIFGGLPRAAFVISRQIAGTRLAADIADALDAYGLPVLKSRTTQRIAYTEALSRGSSVFELDPVGKAAREIQNLTHEILAFLNPASEPASAGVSAQDSVALRGYEAAATRDRGAGFAPDRDAQPGLAAPHLPAGGLASTLQSLDLTEWSIYE
jgi:chromosome partitioning protein